MENINNKAQIVTAKPTNNPQAALEALKQAMHNVDGGLGVKLRPHYAEIEIIQKELARLTEIYSRITGELSTPLIQNLREWEDRLNTAFLALKATRIHHEASTSCEKEG